jgi:hypothetical protein
MSKGGGGPSTTYSEVQQSTSNLPEWARPYYEDLMARTGYETSTDYVPYEGERLAYFSPMEQEAMARFGELGVSDDGRMNAAFNMAQGAGQGFDPGINTSVSSSYRAAAPVGTDYNNKRRDSQYVANQRASQYTANQMDLGEGYQAGSRDVAFDPGTLADKEMLDTYMSPYMQAVVEIQKREAMRDADIRHKQLGLDSAQAGGPRGNYRLGILESETERDLGQRLDDLQAEGLQSAFLNAQQAFEADRSANAQLEAFEQSQFGMNEQMSARAAELMQQGFGMNEAARQAQEEFAQAAFAQNEGARQMEEQFAQSQFGLNEQYALASAQQKLATYNAYEQAKQQAAALGLQADQIEMQGQIAAANVLLGQQQNKLSAAGQMGQLAGQDQAMYMDRLSQMMNVGSMERGLAQQSLDMGYQDFLQQQAWPREQIAFFSNILQGAPIQPGQTTATYGPQPSFGQQALGMGIGGLGLYNAMGGGG